MPTDTDGPDIKFEEIELHSFTDAEPTIQLSKPQIDALFTISSTIIVQHKLSDVMKTTFGGLTLIFTNNNRNHGFNDDSQMAIIFVILSFLMSAMFKYFEKKNISKLQEIIHSLLAKSPADQPYLVKTKDLEQTLKDIKRLPYFDTVSILLFLAGLAAIIALLVNPAISDNLFILPVLGFIIAPVISTMLLSKSFTPKNSTVFNWLPHHNLANLSDQLGEQMVAHRARQNNAENEPASQNKQPMNKTGTAYNALYGDEEEADAKNHYHSYQNS